ncbi:MAG: hypothetical protein JSR64_09660 [Nitrospira sp.]|nr:hypothetical protein [Nitrospira sp.]MBS0194383.1 hypothetical protein [Pseudomonadota bacterium]
MTMTEASKSAGGYTPAAQETKPLTRNEVALAITLRRLEWERELVDSFYYYERHPEEREIFVETLKLDVVSDPAYMTEFSNARDLWNKPAYAALDATLEQNKGKPATITEEVARLVLERAGRPTPDAVVAATKLERMPGSFAVIAQDAIERPVRAAPALDIRRGEYAHQDRMDAQERAMQAVQHDTAALMARYKDLSEAHGGRYVGADLAKELFADYNQSPEARNRYNAPVHNSAAVLAAQLFDEATRDRSHPERTHAVFLTGSPGAGKTSSVMSQGALDPHIAVVYEGQMFRAEQSFPKLGAALAAGLQPVIIAVHPRPETALANTFTRFDDVGRGASTKVMAQIQGELVSGLCEIYSRYGEDVSLRIIDARDQENRVELQGWKHLRTLESEGSQHAIKQRLDQELGRHRSAGTITDACYQQAAGNAPIRTSLADRRMGAGHGSNHERPEQEPRSASTATQAQLLIAQAASRPELRSDELARAHFLARTDLAWASKYDADHGPSIALRSQQLAGDHGKALAQSFLIDGPTESAKQYPELANPAKALQAAAAHAHTMTPESKAKVLEALQRQLAAGAARGELPLLRTQPSEVGIDLDRGR